MNRQSPLPFRLVGMTLSELEGELNDLDVIYDDIPSDSDSVDNNENGDSGDESETQKEIANIIFAEDDLSESDLPLSEVANRIIKDREENEQVNASSSYTPPTWNNANVIEEPQQFSQICGVPDFIKDMDKKEPGDIFRLFLTNDLLEHIKYQTNLYAQQKYLKSGRQFVPTTTEEIGTLIGLNILMGIKRLPSYKDYWSSSPDLYDSYISSKMTLNRFSWLLGNIHLNDNNGMLPRTHADYDKLHKLRPLLDIMLRNFQNNFNLTECIAIDESMVKFKGRSSLKQYMPKKPVKRGYKIWILADQSGYAWNFQIYTGKVKNSIEKSLGSRVVKYLCRDLHNKCHRLYFDNFFSSVPLFEDLLAAKIYSCGTVNVSRRFLPKFLGDKHMKRGEYDVHISDSNLVAVKWKDNRSVHLLSNFHQPEDVVQIKRKERNGDITEIPCPRMIADYNAHMNSVDLFDQKKTVYEIDRKSKKWWHRIFWFFIDACVVNAYIIYSKLDRPTFTMKDFRREICNDLLFNAPTRQRNTPTVQIKQHKPFVSTNIRLKNADHKPVRSTRRRCGVCSTTEHQVRSQWMCDTCKVPLCLNSNKNCFLLFHSK